ncbi:TetR/AcrR family transcriptional regulator [Rufibacter immobilis]|uniref:TetR/AcrR family transcriptional regulator n=1 Tax=Rufibacter immobilis TaxID=1348778 RepID=A0A3M9MQA7_9BACT|nr:TetR/AcrR family transcriptional regulator [Rufibacter immobilis]RNI27714.1 TetR/AcrR family transcriptional regulator [Rufibacter immobilis]
MNKREIQREETVQKIQDVAMVLFAEEGYDRTSIRKIAEKAGVSLGLLYNYYSSKEELLKGIMLKARQANKAFLKQPAEGVPPFQYIEHHVRSTFEALQQNPTFWRLHHSLRMQPAVLKAMGTEEENESWMQSTMLTSKLAAAGSHSPSAEAALMLATLDGIAQHYLTLPTFPLQDVVIRYLLQLKNYLNG